MDEDSAILAWADQLKPGCRRVWLGMPVAIGCATKVKQEGGR